MGLKIKFLDFDKEFNGVNLITDPEAINDKTREFNDDGIFSEDIFGKLSSENNNYQCDCGETVGRFNLGRKCPNCDTIVEFKDPVKRMGWIDLEDHEIINPNFYRFIEKIVGKKNIKKILNYDKDVDSDGFIKDTEESDVPYANIGMKEFKEKFDEILEFYAQENSNRKNIDEYLDLLDIHREKVFFSKIPVFTIVLRPALVIDKNLIFDEVNNFYNSIIKKSNLLKERTKSEAKNLIMLPIIAEIQSEVNSLFKKIIESIKSKNGFIRKHMLGMRINFSARNVISPLPAGYNIDSLVVPYLTFLELYKFQIINILSKIKNISFIEANDIWEESTTYFNEEIYEIMQEIINKTKDGLGVLLNRNPTINIGSILYLKIVDVKDNYSDLTTSVSNNILAPLGGDYPCGPLCSNV